MTQNPFDALGGGGLDLGGLLQQAQAMQEQLVAAQERLADSTVTGHAGGEAVAVTVNGVGELQGVTIAPGSFDAADAESLAELGDLVVAAYRDAKAQADALASDALGPLAGGGLGDLGGLGGLGGGSGDGPALPGSGKLGF